jgi:hypothetical protein
MPIDPMTGQQMPYGDEDIDALAMQEMMGGGMSAPDMSGGGMAGGDMVSVQVPSWAVQAVEELVGILESEIASGNITPDMLTDLGGDMGGMPGGDMGAMPGGDMGGALPPLPM